MKSTKKYQIKSTYVKDTSLRIFLAAGYGATRKKIINVSYYPYTERLINSIFFFNFFHIEREETKNMQLLEK